MHKISMIEKSVGFAGALFYLISPAGTRHNWLTYLMHFPANMLTG
jgi:hypothetical protein